MPTLTAAQAKAKEATEKVLALMLKANAPRTRQDLGSPDRRLLVAMEAAKLVKRAAPVKQGPTGRKAVAYDLTAKGRKRAEKL